MNKEYKSLAILANWHLVCYNEKTYIPTMHYQYIKVASSMYEKVFLLAPLTYESDRNNSDVNLSEIVHQGKYLDFQNVEVIPLPFSNNYLATLPYLFSYWKAIKKVVKNVDLIYCRVPDPYSWMPALFFKNKVVMHFVGDTIDTTQHNEKWSWLKKKVMILGYLPEYYLTILAARRSCVYANGIHLVKKLSRWRVHAAPVISSTIFKNEMRNDFEHLPIQHDKVSLTYIGYIRFAKGMNCLMEFCKELSNKGIYYTLNIVGSGEMFEDVKKFIRKEELQERVFMYGYIDSKEEMRKILHQTDLFFFPSLSEGSPRVVIEAMSQGVPVISTPVGSLPTTFKDGESIRFFGFDDSIKAVEIVQDYLSNPSSFEIQRIKAYQIVYQHFTIEKFLSIVFSYRELTKPIHTPLNFEMGGGNL